MSVKNSSTIENFVTTLIQVIEQSGGLLLLDNEVAAVGDDVEINEDDIEIPQSEFIDGDEETSSKNLTEDESERILTLSSEDIKIAVPKDKTNPYSNNWIEISSDADLSSLVFNDYDIISFSYSGEPFTVVEAAYEE